MLRRRATAVHTCCMPQAILPSTAAADHGAAHGCRTDHESDAHARDQVTHEGTEGEQSGQRDHKPQPPHDALADAGEAAEAVPVDVDWPRWLPTGAK